MPPELMGFAFLALAIALLCIGVHIGLCLAISGFLGILVLSGNLTAAIGILRTTPYHNVASFALTVLPLFVIMGHFSLEGGISERAYRALGNWVGRLPGGLSIATTWASTAFGATSGSSIACVTVFTKLSLPEMKKVGYEPNFACAGIATAALTSMVIPPSLYFVIIAMLTEISIAKLLIAGILPGVFMAVILSMGILLVAARNPRLAPVARDVVTWSERMVSTVRAWPIAVLGGIIIGGIYTGVFSPTEAAAVGAFSALVISMGFGKIHWKNLIKALSDTTQVTAMLSLIIIGATVFSRFLAISGTPYWLAEKIIGLGLSPLALVVVLVVLFILLGFFIDALSIMFITIPIFYPILTTMGVDPIWFAVLTCVSLDFGQISPPFGLVVYAVKAAAEEDVTVEGIFRASLPYYFLMMLCIAVLVIFPQISTFLPNTMIAIGK
jgi:tripartite ATP-independent transporter DctM subunit